MWYVYTHSKYKANKKMITTLILYANMLML